MDLTCNDMPSTMKELTPERNPLFSEADDDTFEEMVCTFKLISFPFPLIRYMQMCSAFRSGVKILSDLELDSILQSKGKPTGDPGRSAPEDMEGIGRVPNKVAQLKHVLDKLTQKVILITI